MPTQSDIDALVGAIARGARLVRYGEKHLEYQSIGEMMEALAAMRKELRDQQNPDAAGTPRYQLANFSDQ
jgi:hypothetical protein